MTGTLLKDQPLANYCSWRIGGLAKQLYVPSDAADLEHFLKNCPSDEPLLWLGLGSNCLLSDNGFDGTVIVTQGALNTITRLDEFTVRAEAGVACAAFARYCARLSLAGVEFLAGIPGTIGGALRMNAGCYNGETWDTVTAVETIDRHGVRRRRSPDDYLISYRTVEGCSDEWFLAGEFTLQAGDKEKQLEAIRDLLQRRADTQPTGEYNCGSVFRNPPGDHAARLIEASGLKGYSIGDAQVSMKHANFIINVGNASSEDVKKLISHIQEQVFREQGVMLHREVHIIDKDTDHE